ncbi:MAG: hypothetical protein ACE5HF_00625 [Gemmatimonadota bacterium]
MKRRTSAALLVLAASAWPAAAPAQEVSASRVERLERRVAALDSALAARDASGIAELRRRIAILTREIEELRLGKELTVRADSSERGLGPAASKVYRAAEGVSLGGYGEMLYENFARDREDGSSAGLTDRLDFLRAILYAGYKFDERFVFNSEIEFEHATTDQAGSVSVEFAYLDVLLSSHLGLRAGLVLPPMGFINEQHEPTTFLGAARPETERAIIPSTWRENGLGLFGETDRFRFRAYLVNGFDAVGGGSSKAAGFSAAGLRGGRQNGSKAVAESLAGVGRVDYVDPSGLTVGSSLYAGDAGQGRTSPTDPSRTVGARTLIWEGHAEYRAHGLDLRGLLAIADVNDVPELNAARGLTGTASIGERMFGWYAQAGYDVLRTMDTQATLTPFVRFEKLNTQDRVPSGFFADPSTDREILTVGAAWKPIGNIVFKADYESHHDEADRGVDRFHLALGYIF